MLKLVLNSITLETKLTYEVLVENMTAENWLDLVHAMATMLATYYNFNVSCDKHVVATLIFFQKYTY